MQISPLGTVPKKDGSLRLILDLSSPRGLSVNDGIDRDEFSTSYSSFDEAVDLVRSLGPGSYMAKIDIKHAFRLCPVRVADFYLLGMFWQGNYFIDTRLPFGSRSSPYIFNTLAKALCWAIIHVCNILGVLHYLDDFFLASSSQSSCQRDFDTILNFFRFLGVPISEDKLVSPSTLLVYLGIEIDSVVGLIRLPSDKLADIQALLRQMLQRHKCRKRDLLSLIGKLSFASKVIKPGRLFLRHLIDLSTKVDNLNKFIVLNKQVKEDLKWWLRALSESNGVSFFQEPFTTSHDLQLFTDASGIGFGACFGSHWFSHAWPPSFHSHSINFKELFAVVVAFEVWQVHFTNKQIRFFCDNLTICNLWRTHAVRNPDILRLIRHLFFRAVQVNCNILLTHIPGFKNIQADLLSRLQVDRLQRVFPGMDPVSTPIPDIVWTI